MPARKGTCAQGSLFDEPPPAIDGLVYQADVFSQDEEDALVREIQALSFGPVIMHGVEARRRVVQFGWRYRFQSSSNLTTAAAIPDFLLPVRARMAPLARVDPEQLAEALVTEYPPGAGIGWHRDAPQFGIIVGLSLVSSCTLRLRPIHEGRGRLDTVSLELEPRSVYVFSGAARSEWQHSIPPAKALRYSVTFRTVRERYGSASR